jgi:hypothetical protein
MLAASHFSYCKMFEPYGFMLIASTFTKKAPKGAVFVNGDPTVYTFAI